MHPSKTCGAIEKPFHATIYQRFRAYFPRNRDITSRKSGCDDQLRRRRRRWKAFRPRAPHPRRGNAARRCFNKRLVPNRKSFNPFRSRLTRVLYAFKRRGYFWRRREGGREARDAQYVINIDRAESGNGSPTPVLRAIPPAIKHFHSHRPLKPAPRKLLYRRSGEGTGN